MAETHFIADLHLLDDHDPKAKRLAGYLAGPARSADALYVLGDLFEVWVGDDGSIPQHAATLDAFSELVSAGVPVCFMRGNRDFAVGRAFEKRSGMRIIGDPTPLQLHGISTLLTHGDIFCTDDKEHQAFREKYTDENWRNQKLAWPLWLRKAVAKWARRRSRRGKAKKAEHIMDVNPDTVARIAAEHGAKQIIHGHTHRPANHESDELNRYVLADWRDNQAEILVVNDNGIERRPIA